MPAVSSQSSAAVVAAAEEAVGAGADAEQLGEELFGVVRLLDSQPSLRRVLTEPTVAAEAKEALVDGLLRDKVSAPAREVVVTAGGCRWSQGRDLADALEQAGISCHLARAEADGRLDDVEDELFRFGRIVEAEPALREALGDRLAPVSAKRRLVDFLLEGKATEATRQLLDQAVTGRELSFARAVNALQRVAAARQDRLVATVAVAAPLSADQEGRLAAALQRLYGHAVHINLIVDSEVLGGVRVRANDEVIDSTIVARLAEARRTLGG